MPFRSALVIIDLLFGRSSESFPRPLLPRGPGAVRDQNLPPQHQPAGERVPQHFAGRLEAGESSRLYRHAVSELLELFCGLTRPVPGFEYQLSHEQPVFKSDGVKCPASVSPSRSGGWVAHGRLDTIATCFLGDCGFRQAWSREGPARPVHSQPADYAVSVPPPRLAAA